MLVVTDHGDNRQLRLQSHNKHRAKELQNMVVYVGGPSATSCVQQEYIITQQTAPQSDGMGPTLMNTFTRNCLNKSNLSPIADTIFSFAWKTVIYNSTGAHQSQ